ncbi:MAG TPA: hypothetical protein VFW44_07370 [Bryobacteraceae bacterium]|nr:hypothetical protein [Bryobacteraceae bacterium]
MPDVLLAYALAALLVVIVFLIAFFIGRSVRDGRFIGFIGLILVALALFEKAGWSVRPWTHGSPAEAFNDLLFRILFLAGFGLLVVRLTCREG